jgi:hypothetical protein
MIDSLRKHPVLSVTQVIAFLLALPAFFSTVSFMDAVTNEQARRQFAVAVWMDCRRYESRKLLSLVDNSGKTISILAFGLLPCDKLIVYLEFSNLAMAGASKK